MMKRMKVTFWLLGFGCGVVFMGILGTWIALTLQVDKEQETQVNNHNLLEEVIRDSEENEDDLESKDSLLNPAEDKNNLQADIINNNEMIVDNKEELIGGEQLQILEENQATEQVEEIIEEAYCEVFIPSTSGSGDICRLLEAAGVVEDGEAFHEYIKVKGKQKYLKDGTFNFPKDANYETLLKILVG